MRDKISVQISEDSPAFSESEALDNKAKTSLRERSMNSDNDYPGVQR